MTRLVSSPRGRCPAGRRGTFYREGEQSSLHGKHFAVLPPPNATDAGGQHRFGMDDLLRSTAKTARTLQSARTSPRRSRSGCPSSLCYEGHPSHDPLATFNFYITTDLHFAVLPPPNATDAGGQHRFGMDDLLRSTAKTARTLQSARTSPRRSRSGCPSSLCYEGHPSHDPLATFNFYITTDLHFAVLPPLLHPTPASTSVPILQTPLPPEPAALAGPSGTSLCWHGRR